MKGNQSGVAIATKYTGDAYILIVPGSFPFAFKPLKSE